MKNTATVLWALIVACSGTLLAPTAEAAMIAQPQVSGHITAVASNEVVVVDGHRYLVAVNSAAYKVMSSLHVGDAVGLFLDGPANNSASHVTAIKVTNAP